LFKKKKEKKKPNWLIMVARRENLRHGNQPSRDLPKLASYSGGMDGLWVVVKNNYKV
jgi:hypothetical protein